MKVGLKNMGYQTVKSAPAYVHLSSHGTNLWRSDRRTDGVIRLHSYAMPPHIKPRLWPWLSMLIEWVVL